MAWAIEESLKTAVAEGVLPGAVLFAKDKSGKIDFSFSVGSASLDPASPSPMEPITLFTLASMTKLLTTISALQLVDRGLISLSDDISPHLPALASQPILSPSGELVPRTRPITLRHLLTHSSGCGYPFLSPRLATHLGPPPPGPRPTSSVPARFNYPLLFEPGTGWAYGSGLDWAGQLVEVLTGEPLLSHMQKHILSPLEIDPSRLGFFPVLPTTTNSSSSPAAAASVAVPHLAKLADRDSQGKVTHGTSPDFLGLPCGSFPDPVPAFGGESGYADMGVYISVLYSLLVDDEKLLSREVAAQMFRPALQEAEAKASLLKELEHPEWIVGVVPKTGKYDWGLGGLLVDGDGDGEGEGYGRRRRGFLFWGGVFNMAWFIDREAGVCGVFGTQIQVPADPKVRPFMMAFEEEIYSKL